MIAEKLRKSILQAAIEGKLTEQLPEDGDARDLVEEIKKEKEELVKAGKIKKEKPLPEIREEEIPFDIPDNWCWVRLGEITNVVMGQSPKGQYVYEGKSEIEFHQGKIFFQEKYLDKSNKYTIKPTKILEQDNVVLSVRAPVGKVNISKRNICLGRGLAGIQKLGGISEEFLFYWIDVLENSFIAQSTGSTFKAIKKEIIENQIIGLPPLNEQDRILVIIKKSMRKLELVRTTELNLADMDTKFPQNLKNSILQSAMQGKLTEQLPEDGDAHDLLEEIQAEKQSLIAEGKLKKQKPLPPITEEEIPFDIPDNWVWVRLGDCTDIYTGNSIPKLKKELEYKGLDEGYPYIATKDVWLDGTIDYKNGVRIPFDEPKFRIANAETPLLCIEGGSAGRKIGMLNQDVCFGNKLCNFNPIGYNEKFLFYSLQSSSFLSNFKESMTGIIGGISLKNLKNIIIPLPPTDEQKRIVSKLEKLLY